MDHLSSRQAVWVWLFLVAATLSTNWLVENHGYLGRWAVASVLVVAAVKVRMVILYYMDIKWSSRAWRIVFELWVLVVVLATLSIWFLSGSK